MARFEAMINPVADGNPMRDSLVRIAQQWGQSSLGWIASLRRCRSA